MINIGALSEGIILDHIQAGKSFDIYYHLNLDKLDCQVAIIKNAKSKKMGKKNIIKIEENVLNIIDLKVLNYINHNITSFIAIRRKPHKLFRGWGYRVRLGAPLKINK